MATIINLRNWLDEEVTFKWDGETYTLAPGEKVRMQEYIARHGAKYIAMAHCNKVGKPIAQITQDFIDLVEKALTEPEELETSLKAEVALDESKSKSKTTKKLKKEEEEVFEGI